MPTQAPKTFEIAQLDGITGGAFSAPTSGERAARVKEWLAGNPDTELQQAVFKELSVKDKGAARWIKERLDEARRVSGVPERRALYTKVAQQLLVDLPRMYLYTPNNIFAMSTKVRGFVPVPDGMIRLHGMSIAP